MAYQLEIKPEAILDVTDAYLYYEEQLDDLGLKFIHQLEEYYLKIQNNPKHFPVKNPPLREAYIKKFPYVIIYAIEKNKVVVYSIFNTYQHPSKKPS